MSDDPFAYLSYALVVPLAWLWSRVNRNADMILLMREELAKHRTELAKEYFSKSEVDKIIDRTVQPIRESVKRIEDAVIDLARETRKNRKEDASK